jgi:hypothetical protein
MGGRSIPEGASPRERPRQGAAAFPQQPLVGSNVLALNEAVSFTLLDIGTQSPIRVLLELRQDALGAGTDGVVEQVAAVQAGPPVPGCISHGNTASDGAASGSSPRAIDVLTLHGTQIQEITAFLIPDAFPNFDLPAILPASGTNS